MTRRDLVVRSLTVPPCQFVLLVAAVLVVGSLVGPNGSVARAEGGSSVSDAFRHAKETFMRGDDAGALEAYRACVELVEKLPAAERRPFLPTAEVALRQMYRLAGATAGYNRVLDTFSRWASFDDKTPAATAPELASLARFFAGAALACTDANADRARAMWKPLGFLDKWWVIGPFDNERGTGFGTSFPPENDTRPKPAVSHPGKSRPVTWRPLTVQPITGWIDLDALMRPRDQAVAYAMTFVTSDVEQEATLRLGSDGGYRLWHNGKLVASRDIHRTMRLDQDVVRFRLARGWNAILIKVADETGRWEFRARLTRPDGSPLTGWSETEPPADATLPPCPKDVLAGLNVAASPDASAETSAPTIGSMAVRMLEERIQKSASNPQDHYMLGVLLQTIGAHDTVEHPDRKALELAISTHEDTQATPPPSSYYYYLAEANRRKVGVTADRDYNAWRKALEKSAGMSKRDLTGNRLTVTSQEGGAVSLRARVDLAEHYLDSFDNLITARAFLESVLEANPDHAEARLLLGSVEASQGFPRATERAYDDCQKRGLESPRILRHEAERARKRGQLDDAQAILTELYGRNLLDVDTRGALASLLLERGRREQAVTMLLDSLSILPFDTGARKRAVSVLSGMDLDRSLEIQRTLVELAPDDHTAHRDEGDLLWEKNIGQEDGQEEAFAAWDRALAIQPNFPELREYVDFLRSRRDPFVEEFQVDVTQLIDATRATPVAGDSMAEVLLDLTALEVHADGTVKEFQQFVVRVLNDRGVRAYDRYRTYFAEGNQRVEFKEARVVRKDGSVERARLREFQGGTRDSGEYQTASVDLPSLEVGDIIEVQYVLEDVYQSFFGDYFGRRESFQSTVPVRDKTYVLRVPAERDFYFHYRNLDVSPTIERDEDNAHVTYTWTRRDIAKLDPEPGMPPRRETDATLEISTFQDWTEFSTWYWNLIRKQYEKSPAIVEKVAEITENLEEREDKIRALYNFVVQEIRYNAWEFGIHGFKPYNAPTIFARRFGDCKDKATLLSVMLDEVGIEAHPVLINATNSRGREDLTLPMVNHFNHCITFIPAVSEDEEDLFLDGTATHNRVEELPSSDSGATVLVVRPEGSSLKTVPWTQPGDLAVEEDVQVHVHADGSAEVEIRGRAVGDYGSVLRNHFEVAGKRKTLLEKIYGRRFAGATVEDEQFSDLRDLGQPVTFRIRLRVPSLLGESPEGLSMRPLDDFFQSNRMLEGLGSLESREHDVVLGAPRRAKLGITVHIPPGLVVKSVPSNRVLTSPSARFETRYKVTNDQVQFTRILELTSPRVAVVAYPQFREITTQLERLREEKWVFTESSDTSN